MLETILFVAVVVAVGAFVAMRTKLKDKNLADRAETAVVNNDVEPIAPKIKPFESKVAVETTDIAPVIKTTKPDHEAYVQALTGGVDPIKPTKPDHEAYVQALTGGVAPTNDAANESNKKPKAVRKTTSARKK
jgi:hypothetical protein